MQSWQWGKVHQILFRHPLGVRTFDRGPVARPGDGNTVNATSGARFQQTNGASYRADSGLERLGPVGDDQRAGRIGRSGKPAL